MFIEFPESIAQGELPPLFVIGAKGEAELVNYRVAGRYMIVDRLFAKAIRGLADARASSRRCGLSPTGGGGHERRNRRTNARECRPLIRTTR